jgi:hypothetical protein
MKKPFVSKYPSGSVFRIPLEHDLGYAYVRLTFFHDMKVEHEACTYAVVDTYLHKTLTPEEPALPFLESSGWLRRGIIMYEYPRQRGENKAKHLGVAVLEETDLLPRLFYTNAGMFYESILNFNDVHWQFIRRLWPNDAGQGAKYKFSAAAHLGEWNFLNYPAVRTMITMYWLKYEGISLSQYYTPKSDNIHDFIRYATMQTEYTPVPYPKGVLPYEPSGLPVERCSHLSECSCPKEIQ